MRLHHPFSEGDRMKRFTLIAAAAAVLMAAPFPTYAKDLGRVFTEVSQRTDFPVLSVSRKVVPCNGNKPITLVTLINCLDQTEAFFNVKTEELEIRKYKLYKGMIKHSGPSWQSELCSNRIR